MKWKLKEQLQTLFESCAIQFSKATWRSAFISSLPSLGLDDSEEFCRHFRKCFIKSDIAPMIATVACCFALCPSRAVTLTMSTSKSGCLATLLWSKCLTRMDNSKCEFSPEVNISNISYVYKKVIWITVEYLRPHTRPKNTVHQVPNITWFNQKWLQKCQNRIGNSFF